MTLKQLSQEFMVHNLTIIQNSDLMGDFFPLFIFLLIITQQVVRTQANSIPFSWLRSILKHELIFIYLLQLSCYPVSVVILHVNKTWNWLLLDLSQEGYMSACSGNLECWEPSQHLLIDTGKPRKTCVGMAGRRTFRVLTSSQQSGI